MRKNLAARILMWTCLAAVVLPISILVFGFWWCRNVRTEPMYMAPSEGYEPSIEIGYKADDANWRSQEKRKFFIKSRNGQNYARIEVTLIPNYRNQAAYDLEWFLNVSGSRNLEFDPDTAIQVNQ